MSTRLEEAKARGQALRLELARAAATKQAAEREAKAKWLLETTARERNRVQEDFYKLFKRVEEAESWGRKQFELEGWWDQETAHAIGQAIQEEHPEFSVSYQDVCERDQSDCLTPHTKILVRWT